MISKRILKRLLITESVSIGSIDDAIDTHTRVIINYNTRGENIATGARIIEVYAYGLTKAGNPVIRAFQPYGDTSSRVPSWKFFRIDRIIYWKPTKQIFTKPASDYYKNIGNFNPNSDNSMSTVYKIAKFGQQNNISIDNQSGPKLKAKKNYYNDTNKYNKPSDNVYKTDTENRMERLRQQLDNPIKLSDLKLKNGFKQVSNSHEKSETEYGPKLKSNDEKNIQKQSNNASTDDVYKTDTEKRMERLRQQLDNPTKIDLDKIPKK